MFLWLKSVKSPIYLANVMAAETESSAKRSRTRSPSYPYLDLPAALEKVTVLWNVEGRHPTAVSVAMQHWGYKEESSTGYSCVAALKKFGLVDHDGMGETRQIRLSALALAILLDRDPASTDRRDALRRAALNPRIHAELWERYGPDLPSDQTLRRFLVIERNFNEASVDELLAEYKATVAFAGLGRGGTAAAAPGALPVTPIPPPTAVVSPRPAPPPEAPRDLQDARERAGRPPMASRPDPEETAAPAPVRPVRTLATSNGSHGPAATDLTGYRPGDARNRERPAVDLFGQPEDRFDDAVAEELLAPLPSRRAPAPPAAAALPAEPTTIAGAEATAGPWSMARRELPVPLDNGLVARVPYPMSEEDFSLLLDTLQLWKKRLVRA